MSATRREFLTITAGGVLVVSVPTIAQATEPDHEKHDEKVSTIEDLMREHGILDRVLLIYEEGIRRMEHKEEIDPFVFHRTASLVRTFVEDYHERLEEQHIFPLFEKADRETKLVSVLKKQHQAGRDVTARILRLAAPSKFRKDASRNDLIVKCREFITMYRPHAAREDTVLFPALHSITTQKQIDDLGEQFEQQEEKLFGEEGFLKIVDQVVDVERKLGIFDLDKFTPTVSQP